MLRPLGILVGLVVLGVILVACGDDATPTPAATRTPQPTSTPTPVQATSTPRPTPTATAAPTATPQVMTRPGKLGGHPGMSTSHAATHFSIWECAGDNTCLAHPAPNYNGLIEYNPETDEVTDLRCDLCTEWDLAADGVTYTFKLHENARWNDGVPVTAEDVVFSLDSMTDPDAVRPKVKVINAFYDSSRAIDDHTVEVKTKFPAAAFLPSFATEFHKIYPKHFAETGVDLKEFSNIMGSGPFKLVEHEKDVKLEYVRNEDYFKEGLPYWDAMTYFIIIDSGTIFTAFKSGQILFHAHPSSGLSNAESLQLADDMKGKGRVIFAGPIAPLWVFMNTNRVPYTDVRVRQAMNLVAHRQPFIQTFSKGVDLLGGPFPPNVWFGIPEEELEKLPGYRETADGKKHPDDIAAARRLLEDVGIVPEEFEVTISSSTFVEFPLIAQLYADQLRTFLGIKADANPMESQLWTETRNSGQYEMGTGGYGVLFGDPHDILVGVYAFGGRGNVPGWSHPRIEEIVGLQAREQDRTKRKALIYEATQIILDGQSPYIMLYHTMRGWFSAERIRNHHTVAALSDALKNEHYWCDPAC